MIDRSDPLWYKDAIVYQLHVKAFFDANNDGIGDLEGLIEKLDYVQDLGVTAVWLLPFYPSPLRDDGYDISDYRNVHPAYGRMQDFKRFVREAHRRGLRVITELVINHTSDQHPWFQRARRARPGSVARNYYVWSDTDQKYTGTRIIFLDTEKSNWNWDPVAQAYYWHRFYSHQPDLNFDNPRVLREVLNALHYWLKIGVDGLRLDAVPYLCEREGTNNENLPETHEILRRIRAEVDAHYPDRMLLAEANQWPEDTQEYFGDGDECHMAFHFPLMPRMYMAIAQEDRHPVTDIMRQTPDIPPSCQWGVFLRNHDELTLEMVTDEERDYLWTTYAADRRMRLNLGIRRRLAPLLERDRRKIQLMHGLLLSLPGTPVLYYGDEIGMGDNIYLGDRDGVRTPMQWSPDRNGGFSRADPAKLYLPPIMDPLYGYEAVNVEAQQRDPSSLLNWVRRLVATRKSHSAFGRGALRHLYPGNRRILAFLRETEEEAILCVANLARTAQAVELNLSEFQDRIPVEMSGRTPFPPIGELPYLLTLGPYEFYWFILSTEATLPRWHETTPPALPEFSTLVMRGDGANLFESRERTRLEQEALPDFLPNHRWYAGKDVPIDRVRLCSVAEMGAGSNWLVLSQLEVTRTDGSKQRYQLPLAVTWDGGAIRHGSPLLSFTLAKVRRFRDIGALHDATATDSLPQAMLAAIGREDRISATDGEIVFSPTRQFPEIDWPEQIDVRRFSVEQSNSSTILGDRAVLKLYRRLVEGPHPEVEIGHFLTEVAGFRHTPPLLGTVTHRARDGTETALGILQGLVFNQGDGWSYTLDYLDRYLEHTQIPVEGGDDSEEPDRDGHAAYLTLASLLGQRTAELHRAFASETDDPAFRVEPIGNTRLAAWHRSVRAQVESGLRALRAALHKLDDEDADAARALLEHRKALLTRIRILTEPPLEAALSRMHGDYHLGQVLLAENDFCIIDFEGEPSRPIKERRAKSSPIKDVAGMLRSFDYAAHAAAHAIGERVPDRVDALRAEAIAWRDATSKAFLKSYRAVMAGAPTWPKKRGDAERLMELFLLEKAFYEICYEAANRPAWLGIPISGALALVKDGCPTPVRLS